MERRKIGSLEVSVVGLGCNNFGKRLDADATGKVVEAALAAGINFFDTADIYGGFKSEEFLGRALGARRSQVIVATKFGAPVDPEHGGAKPAYVKRAVEDSLRRLGTDYIDLYQLHFPDPETPIEQTLQAMDDLVKAGKVRYIGCSNFTAEQLRDAAAKVRPGGSAFVSVQNEYSLLHREPEKAVLPECERMGFAFLPYFPLASGALTGKYRPGAPHPEGTRLKTGAPQLSEANMAHVEALRRFAEGRGHSLLELAFSWLLGKSRVVSVIAGATRPEQVQSNTAAASWRLSAAELAEVDRLVPVEGDAG